MDLAIPTFTATASNWNPTIPPLRDPNPGTPLAEILTVERAFPLDTAQRIVAMAQKAKREDMRIHTLARLIVADVISTQETVRAKAISYYSAAMAILSWVRSRVRYTPDPRNVELVYSPSRLLDLIVTHGKAAEDCDGIAGLTATLLDSIEIPARVKLVSLHPETPHRPTHILAESNIPGMGWRCIDATLSDTDILPMTQRVQPDPVTVEIDA